MLIRAFHSRGYMLTSEVGRLDFDFISSIMGYDKARLPDIIKHSLCLGVYDNGEQIAFVRIITDRETFALIQDVAVKSAYVKYGIDKWLVDQVKNSPALQSVVWVNQAKNPHQFYQNMSSFYKYRRGNLTTLDPQQTGIDPDVVIYRAKL